MELGIVLGRGKTPLERALREIIAGSRSEVSLFLMELMKDLQSELYNLNDRIKRCDSIIQKIYEEEDICRRIGKIPGIGPITATALLGSIGDPRNFKNGRQMSAWLGLVPRQYSTGGRSVLLGISKRGDPYLRSLLVHGARAVLRIASHKQDPRSLWIQKKVQTRGFNKACVAVANRNARVIWAVWAKQEEYRAA